MILLLLSCELIVDVDVPFEAKQITVNSFFNPDSLWSVHLSLNRDILDEKPHLEINEAQVVVFEGDNAIDTLTNIGHGRFRSDNERPEIGKTYTLSVTKAGYSDIYSSSFIPSPSPVTNIDLYESSATNSTMIKVTINDNGAEKNYYELYMDVGTEYYNYTTEQGEYFGYPVQLSSKDPALADDNERFSNSIVFSDARFNGKETELTFQTSGWGLSRHGRATVKLRTVSEDGYNYVRTARLQEMTSGDPFAQPVNVYNNIQNGFGIFAGYSTSVYAKSGPRPVIASIDPPAGKPGDHIIITGEGFIMSADGYLNVIFAGEQYPLTSQIVQLEPTRIEVIIPDGAVTGKVVVQNGGLAISNSDFIVVE